MEDCPEIAQGHVDLKAALLHTARVASGDIEIAEPDEIVMDGPNYRIEYWSRVASTTLILKGGGNAQLVTPWVDASENVRAIEDKCGDG